MPTLAFVVEPGELEVNVGPFGERGAVVRVRGELDVATSPELEAVLDREATGQHVVLDLSACAFLDSSAIRVVLAGAERARGAGGTFSIVAADSGVRRVLEIAGIEEKLPIHPTLEAVAAEAAD